MSLLLWGFLALLVFWMLGAYNRLMRLRSQVQLHWLALAQSLQAQVQALGQRLDDYEAEHTRQTQARWQRSGFGYGNVNGNVNGNGSRQQAAWLDDSAQRWQALTQALRQFSACLKPWQAPFQSLPTAQDMASLSAARQIFWAHWQRMTAEQDDLGGAAVPPDLLNLVATQQTLMDEHLRQHTLAVAQYHAAIEQFPARLLAQVFGFGLTGVMTA